MSRTPIYLRGHLVDNYDGYIIDAQYIKDGYQVVDTLEDRDTLTRRFPINITVGSRVHVRETIKDYRYAGNNQWEEIAEGGGGGGDTPYFKNILGDALTNASILNYYTLMDTKKADAKALDSYQKKLVAGANITIDEATNTISATGGEGTGDYGDLTNKPTIDGNELRKGSTHSELGLLGTSDKTELETKIKDKADTKMLDLYQKKLIAGTNITIDPNTNTISATGGGEGTGDYGDLTNKPTIDGVELRKGSTHGELGLLGTADKTELVTKINDKADTKVLDLYQKKLVAGTNIIIDEATNTISATGSGEGGVAVKGSGYTDVTSETKEGVTTYTVFIKSNLVNPTPEQGSTALFTCGGAFDLKDTILSELQPLIPSKYIQDLAAVEGTLRWHDETGELHTWTPSGSGGISEIVLFDQPVTIKEGTAILDNVAKADELSNVQVRVTNAEATINTLKTEKADKKALDQYRTADAQDVIDSKKQTTLTAGSNITITHDSATGTDVISASGQIAASVEFKDLLGKPEDNTAMVSTLGNYLNKNTTDRQSLKGALGVQGNFTVTDGKITNMILENGFKVTIIPDTPVTPITYTYVLPEQSGTLALQSDLNSKQSIKDDGLDTVDKTIVGAINEVKNKVEGHVTAYTIDVTTQGNQAFNSTNYRLENITSFVDTDGVQHSVSELPLSSTIVVVNENIPSRTYIGNNSFLRLATTPELSNYLNLNTSATQAVTGPITFRSAITCFNHPIGVSKTGEKISLDVNYNGFQLMDISGGASPVYYNIALPLASGTLALQSEVNALKSEIDSLKALIKTLEDKLKE